MAISLGLPEGLWITESEKHLGPQLTCDLEFTGNFVSLTCSSAKCCRVKDKSVFVTSSMKMTTLNAISLLTDLF